MKMINTAKLKIKNKGKINKSKIKRKKLNFCLNCFGKMLENLRNLIILIFNYLFFEFYCHS